MLALSHGSEAEPVEVRFVLQICLPLADQAVHSCELLLHSLDPSDQLSQVVHAADVPDQAQSWRLAYPDPGRDHHRLVSALELSRFLDLSPLEH